MKKDQIIILIILIGVSGFIFKDVFNPEAALKGKLKKFSEVKNCYYDINLKYNYMAVQEVDHNIKQYKKDGSYFAKYYMLSPVPTLVNTNGDTVKFGQGAMGAYFMVLSAPVSESKKEKSLFWLDKINPSDIEKGSVKKIKKPENISQTCDMYSAKLTGSGDADMCVDKNGFPVYAKFKNIDYSVEIVSLMQLKNMTTGKGDVEMKISSINTSAPLDQSFVFPDNTTFISMEDMRRQMQEASRAMAELDSVMGELKETLGKSGYGNP